MTTMIATYPRVRVLSVSKLSEMDYDERSVEQKEDDISSIRNSLGFARKVLATGECDVLVLDEVLGVIDNKIITVDELHELVEHRGDTEVILTGRVLCGELCTFVDEISQISTVRFKKYE